MWNVHPAGRLPGAGNLCGQEETHLSIYLNQIRQLITLQKVDDEIFVLDKELKAAPQEQEALRARFAEVQGRRERQNEKMEHLHEQEKRLGIEIEDDSARIRKSKSKLMQVANSKEYHAMVREMDSLEKVNRDREEEKTLLIEELTLQKGLEEEVETEFAAVQEELQRCEAGLEARVSKCQAERDKLVKRRTEVSKDVPMPVFTRYEFIRERLDHPVIVSVVNRVCGGCHIAIPPQAYIELQKGTQILSCPNCQRLVFWQEHFEPTQKAEE